MIFVKFRNVILALEKDLKNVKILIIFKNYFLFTHIFCIYLYNI